MYGQCIIPTTPHSNVLKSILLHASRNCIPLKFRASDATRRYEWNTSFLRFSRIMLIKAGFTWWCNGKTIFNKNVRYLVVTVRSTRCMESRYNLLFFFLNIINAQTVVSIWGKAKVIEVIKLYRIQIAEFFYLFSLQIWANNYTCKCGYLIHVNSFKKILSWQSMHESVDKVKIM